MTSILILRKRSQAKTLIVDMGFVLEGKKKETLPENMMGTVRLNHIDFSSKLRFVEQP